MANLITLSDILAARDRIAPVAVRTPLVRLTRARLRMAGFAHLADTTPDIYLKDESAQPIGSFKLRGAYNKIAQLSDYQLSRGVITYSSGNHAQGVAYSARALNSKAVIVMPNNTPPVKLAATKALGAEIVLVGPASTDRKLKAEELERDFGYTMVPPYDDEDIIAGQATIGLEILEQLPNVDLVLSPVSGGGLLSGTATAIKLASEARIQSQKENRDLRETSATSALEALSPTPQVFGIEPEVSADAKQSFDSKTLTEWPAEKTTRTLADGLRTQSLGQRNFDHILEFVDGIITVTEDEIRQALRILLTATTLVPEPSGAVTLAAALFHHHELPKVTPSTKIAAILSGGNLDPNLRTQLESEAALARA